MVRVKKKLKRAQSGAWYTITTIHGGIVSMKPHVSVALDSRENVVVRSDGNGLVYQEGVELFD